MSKVEFTIQMDKEVLESAEKICQEQGYTFNDLINIVAKIIVKQGEIPSGLFTTGPFPMDKTDILIEKARLMKEGKLPFVEHDLIED